MLRGIEVIVACRRRDKPAEATDVVFRRATYEEMSADTDTKTASSGIRNSALLLV